MYIDLSKFSTDKEISSLKILKEEIELSSNKYLLFNNKIDKMFELTKSYIDKAWIKMINNTILLLKKVKKIANKIITHLNPNVKFKPFKASFTRSIDDHLIDFKRKINTYNNISELYYAYIESIHFNIINIERAYKRQIDLLNSYYNDLYRYNDYKKVVNESKYTFTNFTLKDSQIVENDTCVMLGEELLNQFAIENIRVFDNIDINDILKAQEINEKRFNEFKEKVIQNVAGLINPSSEYRKIEDKLIASDLTTNEMLKIFYQKVKSSNFNKEYIEFELKNTLNLYLTNDFINNENNLKALRQILTLIMLKSNTIIEAMNNIIRLDAYSVYKAEHDSIESINDISIKSIRKIQNIINKNKSKIFKHNNQFIDFSMCNLGQVCLSKTTVNEVLEKYINLEYNTTLLYLVSNYDITIISHGTSLKYNNFAHFYSHNKDNKYLLECYKEEFDFCANLVNKDIMKLSFEDCKYIESVLHDDNRLRQLSKKFYFYLQLKEFADMYYKRWVCDEVYIPFINNYLEDVESIIYILNKNKFKRILLLICNENIIPTTKPISFYNNSIVTISPIKILQ